MLDQAKANHADDRDPLDQIDTVIAEHDGDTSGTANAPASEKDPLEAAMLLHLPSNAFVKAETVPGGLGGALSKAISEATGANVQIVGPGGESNKDHDRAGVTCAWTTRDGIWQLAGLTCEPECGPGMYAVKVEGPDTRWKEHPVTLDQILGFLRAVGQIR